MYYTVEQELELATLALCDAFLSDATYKIAYYKKQTISAVSLTLVRQ